MASTYPNSDIERTAQGEVRDCAPRALIVGVAEDSPAYEAGFEPGCFITTVDGHPVRDLIDWRWLADDDVITLGYIDLDGETGEVELERYPGESWGLTFDGVVFDTVKQCRNACTFCFMRQLPPGMRPSLTLRDDDYRLSFLAGTFVTFTNTTPADEERIITQAISPLRLSLHAINPEVRRRLIGKHAAHGIEVLKRLLAAGIAFHGQIVLLPGENDGEVLRETLTWAYDQPGILDLCVVPLGFSKHQTLFDRSFNSPESALAVLETLAPFQQKALEDRGTPWVFGADEFYLNAFGNDILCHLPSAEFYGDFEMFEDGVGIVRSFVDDWAMASARGIIARSAEVLQESSVSVKLLQGFAMKPVLDSLLQDASSHLMSVFEPVYVANDYFGGNVNVTGLLCGCDLVAAMSRIEREAAIQEEAVVQEETVAQQEVASQAQSAQALLFAIPRVVFNDDGVTLDGMRLEDMQRLINAPIAVVSCNPTEYFDEFAALARICAGAL